MEPAEHSELTALLHFLDAQRSSVLAIIEGLDDEALRTAVLPSGWTPLGLIEHLTDAEWVWFQRCAAGTTEDPTWERRAAVALRAGVALSLHSEEVRNAYRQQCHASNAVLARIPLSSPRAQLNPDVVIEIADVRWIALHMIEETGRHAGHLDAARELIDGRTGLGPR